MKLIPKVPLILLPGTGCNQLLWQKILPILPKTILPVMPDLSSCASQQEIEQKLCQLPYDKFSLLGFSRGGYLAQAFYAKYPERVLNLALIATSGEATKVSKTLLEKSLTDMMTDVHLEQMIQANTPAPKKAEIFTQLRTMLEQVGIVELRQQLRATQDRHSYLSQFSAKTVPTLVIGACQDRLIPTGDVQRLATSLNTEVDWVDAGHMVPLEKPEELGLILHRWLTLQYADSAHEAGPAQFPNTPAGDSKGFLHNTIDPYTQRLLNEIIKNKSQYNLDVPVLEMGAGRGLPTQKLLEQGFSVIANDTNAQLLAEIWKKTPPVYRNRLFLLHGNLIDYASLNLKVNGIIANRVLHFFSGPDLELLFPILKKWLLKKSEMVTTVASPDMRLFSPLKPVYESNKNNRLAYPGWIHVHPVLDAYHRHHLPGHMHLFTEPDLVELFKKQGFEIVSSGTYSDPNEPEIYLCDVDEPGSRVGIIVKQK